MHHIDLSTITLTSGKHNNRDDGLCIMEAVAWWAEETHTDHPACVSPILGTFGRNFNDVLPDSKRQELKPLIPLLAGTAGDGMDTARSYLALDWLIRTYTPAWLDLAGLSEEAETLRDFRRIVNNAAAKEAVPVVQRARNKANAAWNAARDAAWNAAWDAVWNAAGDAARDAVRNAARAAVWSAAGAAARDAARDAAWNAAWNAAWDAAWDAAGDAAWNAARDAVWDAAGDAAWNAARDAAGKKIAPTVAQLQDSAIGLFREMIAPDPAIP